jgi:hypothetical protein
MVTSKYRPTAQDPPPQILDSRGSPSLEDKNLGEQPQVRLENDNEGPEYEIATATAWLRNDKRGFRILGLGPG